MTGPGRFGMGPNGDGIFFEVGVCFFIVGLCKSQCVASMAAIHSTAVKFMATPQSEKDETYMMRFGNATLF